MLLAQFPLTFLQTQTGVLLFITECSIILALIGMIFAMFTWEDIFKLVAPATVSKLMIGYRLGLINVSVWLSWTVNRFLQSRIPHLIK